MKYQKWLKGIGMYFMTEILCLFLALTLSAVGGNLFRLISCVCTLGILICLYVNFGCRRAQEDQHQKKEHIYSRGLGLSAAAMMPYGIYGILLCLSKATIINAEFYRWYKLLNAPFLQLCNLFSREITSASLTWAETLFLALCNLLPFLVVWVTYVLVRKGVVLEEFLYRKK